MGVCQGSFERSSSQPIPVEMGGQGIRSFQIRPVRSRGQHVGAEEKQPRNDLRETQSCYEVISLLHIKDAISRFLFV